MWPPVPRFTDGSPLVGRHVGVCTGRRGVLAAASVGVEFSESRFFPDRWHRSMAPSGVLARLHGAGRAGRPVAGAAGRWTLRCQRFPWPPGLWCSGLAAIRSALHVRLGAARRDSPGVQSAVDASMERPALGSSPRDLFSRGGDVALTRTSAWRFGQLWRWLIVRRRCRLESFCSRRCGGRGGTPKSRRGGWLPLMNTRRFGVPSELPALVWRLCLVDAPFGISEVAAFDPRLFGSLGVKTGGSSAGMAERGLVPGRRVWRWPAAAWRSNCPVCPRVFGFPGVGSGGCFLPASVLIPPSTHPCGFCDSRRPRSCGGFEFSLWRPGIQPGRAVSGRPLGSRRVLVGTSGCRLLLLAALFGASGSTG